MSDKSEATDPYDALNILDSRGVTLEQIVNTAFKLYEGEEKKVDELKKRYRDVIKKEISDKNIYFLLISAFTMEEEKQKIDPKTDPVDLIADELIGINIAEYIGGKKALFNFIRYDRKKPGILAELPPFLDDAVGGLIAGCMTKMFENEEKRC